MMANVNMPDEDPADIGVPIPHPSQLDVSGHQSTTSEPKDSNILMSNTHDHNRDNVNVGDASLVEPSDKTEANSPNPNTLTSSPASAEPTDLDQSDPDHDAPKVIRDANQSMVALLAGISASLEDIRAISTKFMSIVDSEELKDARRQNTRHTAAVEDRSASRSIRSATSHTTSSTNSSDQSEDAVRNGRERRQGRRTTRSSSRGEIVIVEETPVLRSQRSRAPRQSLARPPSIVIERRSQARRVTNKFQNLTTLKYTDSQVAIVEVIDEFEDDADSETANDVDKEKLLDTCSEWLKEKRLIFSRDERCSFGFDTVALLTPRDLQYTQLRIEEIEEFARNLRKTGGFFFFREASFGRGNKIYNGTHVFRCEDGLREALPRLSAKHKNFCEDFPVVRPPWREDDEVQSLNNMVNKREEATRLQEISTKLVYNHSHLDPSVLYHFKGSPISFEREKESGTVVTEDHLGNRSYGSEIWQRFEDPHVTGPWRRLCVLTGVSNISNLERDNIYDKIPLFRKDHKIDRGKVLYGKDEISSSETDDCTSSEASDDGIDMTYNDPEDEGSEDGDVVFLEESIVQHLNCEQLSMRKYDRKRIVKFQFSWYELIPHDISEEFRYLQRYSGRLYRDNKKRSIQLQSFMAIAFWQQIHEDMSRDCQYWTLIILAPAFFYHSEGTSNSDKHTRHLIAPLKDVLPTISSMLQMIISRILMHWAKVSGYIEKLIAGQDTFLDEERHDSLLFDDDNFTRSRQYFWVINSIEGFVLIIDETINHYENVRKWVCPKNRAEWRKHEIGLDKLKLMKQRFENQRNKATMLRDGLFSASSVFESRLSTKLAQNVRLLTYVSIFYLPLAFCAALWAIPNITQPSTRTPFIIAAVLVGFFTYFVVFNLDGLISLGWTAYSGFRGNRIEQMSTDEGWQKRAQSYRSFQPDKGKTKDSEWYILLYALLHPFRRSRGLEDSAQDDEEYSSSEDTSISTRASRTSDAEKAPTKPWKLWPQKLLKKMQRDEEG
ncbi:uncharacterized protein KY384_005004 [Bacidia gigantensis]|uniref:uncharacterized protein n=1 Tax=Bacidia gigantensis TaxID=2732470 RepID=UPI001D03C097|nr:uncharacterized protein KY384_005004 [Bacidia gigantensis]KAG8530501.1 hypothetical protein KY384_005004 [Bacidia gigantensis]